MRRLSPAELQHAVSELEQHGYTILPALLDSSDLDVVTGALRPFQDAAAFGENDFIGRRTRRVFNLVAKTRALDPLLLNPQIGQILTSALGEPFQLSVASTMEIFPGETAQPLHQDDPFPYPIARPRPPLVTNTMWALSDFTDRNGATRIVPGSHTSDQAVNSDEPTIPACMERGSALIWNGAVWHGGGANRTKDEVRFGVSLNYCRGWLRQQENQYLAVDREIASRLPEDLQKLIGYDMCAFMGIVDRRHPLDVLRSTQTALAKPEAGHG